MRSLPTRTRALSLLVPFALAAAPQAATAAPAWERADESIQCADTEGGKPFYNGASASTVYDATFKLGHGVPQALLDGYVPQGLGTWKHWGGKGKHLLIQSAYNDETGRAVIVGMVPGGGSTRLATLTLPGRRGGYVNGHVGGVAVVDRWLYVSGPAKDGLPTVLRYHLSNVGEALSSGGLLRAQAQHKLRVGAGGFAASFIAPQGRSLWIGTFSDGHRNRMHRFAVGGNGGVKRIGAPGAWVQVPKKAQGLAVTKTHWIFSTSYGRGNRSNVYVIRRGHKYLDGAYPQDLRCFTAPSMSEGVTLAGSRVFLSFESGSYKYRSGARNVITHLHHAARKTLLGMT